MDEYEKINNEIKQLMNTTAKPAEYKSNEEDPKEGNIDQLIKILSDLIRVYKDIQLMLESNDNEGVKNRLLSDDIKISLVCESLMKVLKDECSEKKEAYKLLEEEKDKNKSLNREMEEAKHKLRKLESDMEYLSNGNKELNRIILDQKTRVATFKDKADLEKRGADTIRVINKELENLRLKALEKNEVLVKEMAVLKSRLDEKDKTIRRVTEELKEKERDTKTHLEKASTLERNFNTLRKKLETKEESLDVCNSELAKLITKNKRCESMLEDVKGKAAYYERLYKAINKQNEYLNEQLAKLINVDNAGKLEISHNENEGDLRINETLVTATSDVKKLKGYKRRLKKYKRRFTTTQDQIEKNKEEMAEINKAIERLRLENMRLQEEKEKAIDSNNHVTDTLLNKVEHLLEKNRQYQKMLYDQQEGSTQANESFRTVNEENLRNKETPTDLESKFKLKNSYDTKLKVRDFDSSTLFTEDLAPKSTRYQRSFKLHNEYDLERQPKYHDITFTSEIPKLNGGMKSKKDLMKDLIMKDDLRKDLIMKDGMMKDSIMNDGMMKDDLRKDSIMNDDLLSAGLAPIPDKFYAGLSANPRPVPGGYNEFKLTDRESEEAEVKSLDSGKSLQTTSTLKEMIKKTETLQNKFDDLEKQLDEIKQSDDPQPKKLHDQIKAYTDYYYSDYLDFSNEEDFL